MSLCNNYILHYAALHYISKICFQSWNHVSGCHVPKNNIRSTIQIINKSTAFNKNNCPQSYV